MKPSTVSYIFVVLVFVLRGIASVSEDHAHVFVGAKVSQPATKWQEAFLPVTVTSSKDVLSL